MLIRSRTPLRLCAATLLMIFMTYYIMMSFYTHVHLVNGIMIVHSHPFSHYHDHTSSQTLVLHFMTLFQSLEMENSEAIQPEYKLVRIVESDSEVFFDKLECPDGLYLRAPPVIDVSNMV